MTTEQQTNDFVNAVAQAADGLPGSVVLSTVLALAAQFRTQTTRADLMAQFSNALAMVEQHLPPIPQDIAPAGGVTSGLAP